MRAKTSFPLFLRVRPAKQKRREIFDDTQSATDEDVGVFAAAQRAHEGHETVYRLEHGRARLRLGSRGAGGKQEKNHGPAHTVLAARSLASFPCRFDLMQWLFLSADLRPNNERATLMHSRTHAKRRWGTNPSRPDTSDRYRPV